jgi:hypothetical protein
MYARFCWRVGRGRRLYSELEHLPQCSRGSPERGLRAAHSASGRLTLSFRQRWSAPAVCSWDKSPAQPILASQTRSQRQRCRVNRPYYWPEYRHHPLSGDLADMLAGKLGMVHSHRSIDKPDCHVRGPASEVYQRCESDQVQRRHKISLLRWGADTLGFSGGRRNHTPRASVNKVCTAAVPPPYPIPPLTMVGSI